METLGFSVLQSYSNPNSMIGLPWWLSGKDSICQCRRHMFYPWSPWSGKDSTCHGTTKPICHNYWACGLEPRKHNYWVHVSQILKTVCSRAHALQQEKPLQWEAHALQLESSPDSTQLEENSHRNKDSAQPKVQGKKWHVLAQKKTH